MGHATIIGLAALAAAVAGPAWADGCGAEDSFSALSGVECHGAALDHGQASFFLASVAVFHAYGHANQHAQVLNAVPEPGTLALLSAGVVAVGYKLRRRRA
jgi:hypothetical protein